MASASLIAGCADDEAGHGSSPAESPGSVINVNPDTDRCCRNEQELAALLGPRCECDEDDPACVLDDEACGALDLVCDPLRSMTCSGTYRQSPEDGVCPAPSVLEPATGLCMRPAQRICTTDEQCPNGAHCDLSRGGICRFACLPDDTCEAAAGDGVQCCGDGEFCDCRGRCVASDYEQVIAPTLLLPAMSVTPATAELWRGGEGVPMTGAKVSLSRNGNSEALNVYVVASRGLTVACVDGAGGTEPSPEAYVQACELEFAGGEEPISTRNLWVRLNEPAGASDESTLPVELRLVLGAQMVTTSFYVTVDDPPVAATPLVLQGTCTGTAAFVPNLASGAPPASVISHTQTLAGGYFPIQARVALVDGTWPAHEYTGNAVRIDFTESSGMLAQGGKFARTWLVDAAEVSWQPTERTIPVAGEGPFIWSDPLGLEMRESNEAGELTFNAKTGALRASFILDFGIRGSASSMGSFPLALDLTCDGELPGDDPPVYVAPPTVVAPVAPEVAIGLALTPSTFPSWQHWLDIAREGTIVSCGPALVGQAGGLVVCEDTLGPELATSEADATEVCELAFELLETEHFGTPPFDASIAPHALAPCDRTSASTLNTTCDAECPDSFDVELSVPGGGVVTVGFCPIDRTEFQPVADETLDEWLVRRGLACAHRFMAFDPEAGFIDSASDSLASEPLPVSREPSQLLRTGDRRIPVALGLAHWADRKALGSAFDEPLHHRMAEWCRQDLTSTTPPLGYSASESALAERVAAVFSTKGCIGRANVLASLAWLDTSAGAGSEPARVLLIKRVMQLLQSWLLVSNHDAETVEAARLVSSDDPDEATVPDMDVSRIVVTPAATMLRIASRYLERIRAVPDETMALTFFSAMGFGSAGGATLGQSMSETLVQAAAAFRTLADYQTGRSTGTPTVQVTISSNRGTGARQAAIAFVSLFTGQRVEGLKAESAKKKGVVGKNYNKTHISSKPCHIWDGENGLCESSDVPIYFVDPAGTNSRFFATSDYLMSNWARPAFAEAAAAVERLRASHSDHLERQLTISRESLSHEAEIDAIAERFGGRIASLCGFDKRRVENELMSVPWASSDDATTAEVVFNSACMPLATGGKTKVPFMSGDYRCFVEEDREIEVNQETTTCREFLHDFGRRMAGQAVCGQLGPNEINAVRTVLCTSAALRAFGMVGQNAPELEMDYDCGQMSQQEVWDRAPGHKCGDSDIAPYPRPGDGLVNQFHFGGIFRAVTWWPWLTAGGQTTLSPILDRAAMEMASSLHSGSGDAAGIFDKAFVQRASPFDNFTTVSETEQQESDARPYLRSVAPVVWRHTAGHAIAARSDWTWEGTLEEETVAETANTSRLESAERFFGIRVGEWDKPLRITAIEELRFSCEDGGPPDLKTTWSGYETNEQLSIPLESGWWEPLELNGFPECTWDGAQMESFWNPAELLPPLVGGTGVNADIWWRLHSHLGLPGVETGQEHASGVPVFYKQDPFLEDEYERFGGRHIAYQPNIVSDLATVDLPVPGTPSPGGCQAYLHGRSLAAIYATCKEWAEEVGASSAQPMFPPDSVDPTTMASCIHGDMGQALLGIFAARSRVAAAQASLTSAMNAISAQSSYCIDIENANEAQISAHDELKALRERQFDVHQNVNRAVGFLSFVFSIAAAPFNPAEGASGAFDAAAGLVGGAINEGIDKAVLKAENAFENLQLKVAAHKEAKGCWLEVSRTKFQIDMLTATIQTEVLGAAQSLVLFNQLESELEAQRQGGAATLERATDRFERLNLQSAADNVEETLSPSGKDIALDTIEAFADEVVVGDTDRAVNQLKWAMKMLVLVVRAAQHEAQATISFGDQKLKRTLEAILDVEANSARVADISLRDLDDLLHAVEVELATRSINGARPDDKQGVLSLRDDLLALSDHSCTAQTCQSDCEAEFRPDPIDRLRTTLTDPKYALYDDRGQYLGQAIPFAMTPQSELLYRCAEKIWSVSASVEGDLLSLKSPRVPLFVLKSNTFESQWCGDPAAHPGVPRQIGTWQPLVNHFRDIDDGAMPTGEAYTWAHIDGWVNVRRADLHKDAYTEGSSDELAGRGLYGNYLLLFPYHGLLDNSPNILTQIDDVLLRVDYVSVSNGASNVDFAGVSGLSAGSPTLLPPGELCVDPDECITGFCVDARCCNSACTGACRSCSMSGECEARPPGTPTSGCGNYAFCGGGGECMTSCEDHTTCSSQAFCSPGEGPSPTGSCIAKYAPGQGCGQDVECMSGMCVDGVCCSTECDGPCETCGAEGYFGECVAVPLGSEEPLCGAYVYCDDAVGGACATSCDGHIDCTAGHYCDSVSDTCEPVQGLGASCGSPEACESGFCAEGTCCDSACADACQTCNEPTFEGQCLDVAAGSEHVDCAPFLCEANGVCPATCDAHSDCMDGYYCSPSTETCVAELAQGNSCTAGYQCGSGNCVDYRCCDTACTSTCFACNIAGSLGTCTAEAVGSSCGSATCSNAELTPPPECNSSQECSAGSTSACANALTCADASSCRSSCTTSSHCVTGYFCCQSGYDCATNGACTAKKAESASCNDGDECQSGSCVSNACTAP